MTHSFPTRRSSDRDGPTAQWMLRMDCDPLYLPQVTVLQDGRVVASSRRSDARAVSVATGAALAVGQRFPIDIPPGESRSEEHTSELQSLMRISYAVFCLQKKKTT